MNIVESKYHEIAWSKPQIKEDDSRNCDGGDIAQQIEDGDNRVFKSMDQYGTVNSRDRPGSPTAVQSSPFRIVSTKIQSNRLA